MKFKKGQKVVRMSGSWGHVERGCTYIVDEYQRVGMKLRDLNGTSLHGSYDDDKFELAVEEVPDILSGAAEIAKAAAVCAEIPGLIIKLQKELDEAKNTLLKYGLKTV